jgi:hypothetical protein
MFTLRTTQMPSLAQLLQIEQIVAVDLAGPNLPASPGAAQACLVGEFPQGPFTPQLILSTGDITALFQSDPSKLELLSQGSFATTIGGLGDDNDGAGIAFDGNGFAELKGKTFSGLVIQRVDSDIIVAGDGSSQLKAFISFNVNVGANDLNSGATATNKQLVIPAGTRFANNASLPVANCVIATSQQFVIPAGTPCTGVLAVGINAVQDPATGILTYVATGGTMGVTCFLVLGSNDGGGPISNVIDPAIPGADPLTSLSMLNSTISVASPATRIPVYAPAGGAAQPTYLSDCIALCYPAAIAKTLPGTPQTNNIIAIWSARNYKGSAANIKAIRLALWNNAIQSSATGRGRVACVTAFPAQDTTGAAAFTAEGLYLGLKATDGVAASNADADRYWVSGPYVQVWSTELAQDITISVCGARAAMKVNLYNAGKSEYQTSVGPQENGPLQNVDALEVCFQANAPQESDFISFKAGGVAWLTNDPSAGWWFYSGVTGADPVQFENRVADNRRSFADEIEDMVFALAAPYAKKPGTVSRADGFVNDMNSYLDPMKNPTAGDARCEDYKVSDGAAAGNTATLNAQGVYLFQVAVQMFGDLDYIVVQASIGPNVVITQTA